MQDFLRQVMDIVQNLYLNTFLYLVKYEEQIN